MEAQNNTFVRVLTYDEPAHRTKVQELERECETGSSGFRETSGGDPFCRIRHTPISTVLVAEIGTQLVGIIRGTVKQVSLPNSPSKGATVGYILGLRVSPLHRRKGVGRKLVGGMEEWFARKEVEYSYMATGEENRESVGLFVESLKYEKIKSVEMVVNPVGCGGGGGLKIAPFIAIAKLGAKEAEILYREYMGKADFFPKDIEAVLGNKLSLGTWVAWWCSSSNGRRRVFVKEEGGGGGLVLPESWAMGSVWESGEAVKIGRGRKKEEEEGKRLVSGLKQWVRRKKKVGWVSAAAAAAPPEVMVGFYFVYGVHCEGVWAGELVKGLFRFVYNMGERSPWCGAVVIQVGGGGGGGRDDDISRSIPYSAGVTRVEDVWCMKFMRNVRVEVVGGRGCNGGGGGGGDFMRTLQGRGVFVDPREL